MRICIVVLFLAGHIHAGFLDTVSSFLSGSSTSSSTVSPNSILSALENSSLGQAVASGISTYQNTSSSDLGATLLSSVQNSSLGQAVISSYNEISSSNASEIGNNILSSLQNSSIGVGITSLLNGNTTIDFGNITFSEAVLNGLSFLSGNSSETTLLISSYVPFLANASANATQSFTSLLPTLSNLTIAEFETAVDSWAAQWNLTDAVNAFNTRADNITLQTEQNAARVVMSLDLVLTNLKSIRNNTNQTFAQMYNSTLTYLNTLDDDTRAIVFILYRSALPPQLQMIESCSSSGISGILQSAGNYLSGVFSGSSSSNSTDSVNQVLSRIQSTEVVETTTSKTTKKKTTKKATTKKAKTTTTAEPAK